MHPSIVWTIFRCSHLNVHLNALNLANHLFIIDMSCDDWRMLMFFCSNVKFSWIQSRAQCFILFYTLFATLLSLLCSALPSWLHNCSCSFVALILWRQMSSNYILYTGLCSISSFRFSHAAIQLTDIFRDTYTYTQYMNIYVYAFSIEMISFVVIKSE